MTVDWDRVAKLAGGTIERGPLDPGQRDSLAWIVEKFRQSKGAVLADEDYLASGPGELPPGRLEMRTWKPPGRAKGRLHAGDSTRLSAAALT